MPLPSYAEYGIVGVVLAATIPLVSLIVKGLMKSQQEATQALQAQRHQELISKLSDLENRVTDALNSRDRACNDEHTQQQEELHHIYSTIKELSVMLTFVINYFIKDGSKV
jgi:hypothetical protein